MFSSLRPGSLRAHFSGEQTERIQAACATIRNLERKADHLTRDDHDSLRKAMGTLEAARELLDAEFRKAPWIADPARAAAVFDLEASWYEGDLLRDECSGDLKLTMDAKLAVLREIINDIKAGCPLRES